VFQKSWTDWPATTGMCALPGLADLWQIMSGEV
jgi:hypothetical protein